MYSSTRISLNKHNQPKMMPIISKKEDNLKTMNFSFKSNISKLFGDSYFAESKKSMEKSQKSASSIKKEDSTTEFDYEV